MHSGKTKLCTCCTATNCVPAWPALRQHSDCLMYILEHIARYNPRFDAIALHPEAIKMSCEHRPQTGYSSRVSAMRYSNNTPPNCIDINKRRMMNTKGLVYTWFIPICFKSNAIACSLPSVHTHVTVHKLTQQVAVQRRSNMSTDEWLDRFPLSTFTTYCFAVSVNNYRYLCDPN